MIPPRAGIAVVAGALLGQSVGLSDGRRVPATLALRLGLPQLLRKHLVLGGAPGRANTGDKMMTLVASALAGGDCIDDADALRAGGTARVLGFTAKAPSTLGTFLRSFRWGYVRQLNRVSRQLLARAWAAGAGPGDSPLTIDLDSTICETYGLAKEGARHHGYTGTRGYHPLLAIAAGTGEVLMSRRAAEVKVMVDEFPQAQVPGEGGWQEQAGIGHQAMVVKEDADTVGFVLWQHLLGAPCFRAGFCSKTIIPDSEEHPLASSTAVPKAVLQWIRERLNRLRKHPSTRAAGPAAPRLKRGRRLAERLHPR